MPYTDINKKKVWYKLITSYWSYIKNEHRDKQTKKSTTTLSVIIEI